METKPGSRARSEELFKAAVARLSNLHADLPKAERQIEQTSQEMEGYREQFAQRPLTKRLYGGLLDVLRIKPIIPFELGRRYNEAQNESKHLHNLLDYTASEICYYGRNLPGKHDFVRLSYDATINQFNVAFSVPAMIDNKERFFWVEGAFDTLHYMTVQNGVASVRIHRTDSLSPVLHLPKGREIRLLITGYNGPGAYDKFWKPAVWQPEPKSVPIPIDPKEFELSV